MPPIAPNSTDPKRIKDAMFLADLIDTNVASVPTDTRKLYSKFFVGVTTKTRGIREVINRTGRCTIAQMEALENMLHGVRRWTHGEDA